MSISEDRIVQLALEHLEKQKRDIEDEIDEIRSKLGHKGRGRPVQAQSRIEAPSKRGRKSGTTMSAAHRKAIAESMKRRWAERKGSGEKG